MEPCPYFVEPLNEYNSSNTVVIPDDAILIRNPLIPTYKFFPTYLIWVDNVQKLLQIFDKTVMICDQKVDAGIYNEVGKYYDLWDFKKSQFFTFYRVKTEKKP